MKFTLSWLKDFLETQAPIETIAEKLTALGLEVESVKRMDAGIESFTIAKILETSAHPDADKLQICRVETHDGIRQIVCGAPNARAGIYVVLADIGTVIPTNNMKIKPAKIRGIDSHGMLCSARELDLGDDDAGIMELGHDAVIGNTLTSYLGLDDVLLDIAITPNRGDCLSVYGIARDLAAGGIGELKTITHQPLPKSDSAIDVRLNADECPHFVACHIKGVHNKPSPTWLQRRLESVGQQSISALVDITNYINLTYGKPLHVYDAATISGAITVRHSTDNESFHALDGVKHTLPKGLCVVADERHIMGLAGIIGGADSACTLDTQDIIVESAWFDPVAIANAGRITGIDSDARYRFERGVDPQGTIHYASLAIHMMMEVCGGDIDGITYAGEAIASIPPIMYSPDMLARYTGVEVDNETQHAILTSLGCHVSTDGHVTPPSWRSDLTIAHDLMEDIMRIYGYEHIPSTPLPVTEPVIVAASPEARIRKALSVRGLDETIHYAFTSKQDTLPFADDTTSPVHIENPISADLSVMRTHLLCNVLPAVKRNSDNGHKDMAIYEIGSVFTGCEASQQIPRATSVRTGQPPLHWQTSQSSYTIYDAKADLYAMLEALGVPTHALMITRDVPAWYHPGRAGRVSLGMKQILGYFGELHPACLRHFGLHTPVMASECLLNNLPATRKTSKPKVFTSNSFQASRRDFAFITPAERDAGQLIKAIANVDKAMIRNVTLFDVYEGKHVSGNNKSLAFSVTLQADDRTLTEEDITQVSDGIINAVAKHGATLRN